MKGFSASSCSNKTLFGLSSVSQVLVPYRHDRSVGSSQQVSSQADLLLSVVGVDLHFSTSRVSFCLQIVSAFWVVFFFSTDFLPGLWFQDDSVVCLSLAFVQLKAFAFLLVLST